MEIFSYLVKQWFDEESSKLLDQREEAKFKFLQNPSQTNSDKLNNLRRENSKTFRNKKGEYVKEKINRTETNGKNNSIKIIQRHK
jgi:hypothetical protein